MTSTVRSSQLIICQNKKTYGIVDEEDGTINDPYIFVIDYDMETSLLQINDEIFDVIDKDNLEEDQMIIYEKYINAGCCEMLALLNANIVSIYQNIDTPDDYIIIELLGELIYRLIDPDKKVAENYTILIDEWQLCSIPNKVSVNLPDKGSKLGTIHELLNNMHNTK